MKNILSYRFLRACLIAALSLVAACTGTNNNGKDPNAGLNIYADNDGDGFTIDGGDCDDTNNQILGPDGFDDCTDDLDNNCDGIVFKCNSPTVVFRDTTAYSGYFTHVYPHGVSWSAQNVDNDEKVEAFFFDLNTSEVTQTNTLFTAADSDTNADSGIGGVFGLDDLTCVSAVYHNEASGQTCCYEASVLAAQANTGGILDCSNASLVINGDDSGTYTGGDMLLHDVNADGNKDLLVTSTFGLPSIVLSNGLPFGGTFNLPTDANMTLDPCQNGALSGLCGYRLAASSNHLGFNIVNGDDAVEFFEFPLLERDIATPYLPTGEITGDDSFGESISTATRGTEERFLVTNPLAGKIKYYDGTTLASVGNNLRTDIPAIATINGTLDTNGFGNAMETMVDLHGDTLLIVGANYIDTAQQVGLDTYAPSGVFVFNITQNGYPSSTSEATNFLHAPDMETIVVNGDNFGAGCGNSVSGGIVRDGDVCHAVVSTGCRVHLNSSPISYGGAAYVLESMPCGQMPPPPPLANQLVNATDNNTFTVDESLPLYYAENPEQFSKLAQVLQQSNLQGEATGYKISRIRPELEALGLNNGDIITHANGIPLKNIKNVLKAYKTLKTTRSISLTVVRQKTAITLSYQVVQ